MKKKIISILIIFSMIMGLHPESFLLNAKTNADTKVTADELIESAKKREVIQQKDSAWYDEIRINVKSGKVKKDGKKITLSKEFNVSPTKESSLKKNKKGLKHFLESREVYTVREDGDEIVVTNPYQLKRLIVISEQEPQDTYGAINVVSDIYDTYYMQYETEEQCRYAREAFEKDAIISHVSPDQQFLIETSTQTTEQEYLPSYFNNATEFASWGGEYMEFTSGIEAYQSGQYAISDVTVAVIDSGIDAEHPALEGRLLSGYDAVSGGNCTTDRDTTGHGTHVAGIVIDATPDNVKVLPIASRRYNTKEEKLTFSLSDLRVAINYAIDSGVKIINMSLGGEGDSDTFDDLFKKACEKGIVIVAAAGNETKDVKEFTPANSEYTIAVSACNSQGALADFSNRGELIDYIAPGVKIKSTIPDHTYKELSGTSMAAPFVSAAFAYIKMVQPDYSVDECKTAMNELCIDMFEPGRDIYSGNGLISGFGELFIQYGEEYNEVTPTPTPTLAPTPTITPTSVPTSVPTPTLTPSPIPSKDDIDEPRETSEPSKTNKPEETVEPVSPKDVIGDTLVVTQPTSNILTNSMKLAKVVVKKLKTKKTSIMITVKKQAGAQKYRVCYSTKKSMKGAKYKTFNKTTFTIRGLKKKTNYYIKVQALAKKYDKTWKGSYSKVKSAKTK